VFQTASALENFGNIFFLFLVELTLHPNSTVQQYVNDVEYEVHRYPVKPANFLPSFIDLNTSFSV